MKSSTSEEEYINRDIKTQTTPTFYKNNCFLSSEKPVKQLSANPTKWSITLKQFVGFV